MIHICLDTETTGFSPEKGDRIVEIACVELENYIPTGREYHTYINPERDIPQDAFDVHGLSAEFLSDYPVFAKIADDFLEFIGDLPLVIHNAKFDMGFLNAELALIGKPSIENKIYDSMVIARKKYGGGQKLDDLCKRFSISLEGREKHGALTDTHLLAKVWQAMKEDSEAKPATKATKKDVAVVEDGAFIALSKPAVEIFTQDGISHLKESVELKIASFAETPLNMDVKKDRDSLRSFSANIASFKVGIEKMGKSLLDDMKKPIEEQEKRIKATRDMVKKCVEMLQNLQNDTRKPLTEYEEAEKKRIEGIQSRIRAIKEASNSRGEIEQIEVILKKLEAVHPSEFQEFEQEAVMAIACTKETLEERIAFLKREAELKIKEQELEKQRIAQEIEAQANALAQQKVIEAEVEKRLASVTQDVVPRHIIPDVTPETVMRNQEIRTNVMIAIYKYTDMATAEKITKAILGGEIPHISIDYGG